MVLWMVVGFCAFWSALQLGDKWLLGGDRLGWYTDARLNGTININHYMLTFHTDRFNRKLTRLGHRLSAFGRVWFWVGSVLTLAVFFLSVPFLITSIVKAESDYSGWLVKLLHAGVISESAVPLILPPSPPLVNFIYIFVSVSVAVVFHELGHALCAVAEGAPLINVGVLCFLCFPGAFVKMDLSSLSVWPRLRTFSGGVWHNLVLSFVCYVTLEYRDLALAPLYSTRAGFVVLDIAPHSPIGGEYGVARGDILTRMNDCDLAKRSFEQCVKQLHHSKQLGFCSASHYQSPNGPCRGENATHISFFVDDKEEACLRARTIVEESERFCFASSDCDHHHKCLAPIVNETANERLVVIHAGTQRVLYLGAPGELLHSVVPINYVPRWWLVPLHLPQVLLRLLDYIFTFSLGMACFNALPGVILDGNHISGALIELAIPPEKGELRLLLRTIVNVTGTFLIGLFVAVHLIKAAM